MALDFARELVTTSDEYGLQLWLAFGNIDLGCAEAELGSPSQGIERIRRGLDAYEASGAKLWRPLFLGMLATALIKAGRVEEASLTVSQAGSLAEQTNEGSSRDELRRISLQLGLS